jgi:hypothetical protein
MSCHDLALRLTENYYTATRFNSTNTNLTDYLNHNGILLTMCIGNAILPRIFGGPCKLGFRSHHVSASWIRKNETGFRVFGSSLLADTALPVGLILDPTMTQINCMYPIDGVTDAREKNGCGVTFDSIGGPSSIRRSIDRYAIAHFKNSRFGKDTKWSDIDCSLMFSDIVGEGNFALNDTDCSGAVAGGIPFVFESPARVTYETWSDVMGHPVCNITQPWTDPTFTSDDVLLYLGSCVWKTSDWAGMIDTTVNLATEHPSVTFWNEIVLSKPKDLADIVQAVFIVDGSYALQAAKWEATRLGKPLLILSHSTDGNISFTCDEVTASQ